MAFHALCTDFLTGKELRRVACVYRSCSPFLGQTTQVRKRRVKRKEKKEESWYIKDGCQTLVGAFRLFFFPCLSLSLLFAHHHLSLNSRTRQGVDRNPLAIGRNRSSGAGIFFLLTHTQTCVHPLRVSIANNSTPSSLVSFRVFFFSFYYFVLILLLKISLFSYIPFSLFYYYYLNFFSFLFSVLFQDTHTHKM